MTQYKYQLDPTSKKFKCPKCGIKNALLDILKMKLTITLISNMDAVIEKKCAHFHKPTNTKAMNLNTI